MGFEISVAAGLVSLHLCDFTPRTSHLAPRTWKQEIIRSFLGPRGVLRVENISPGQHHTIDWSGWVCSENCKENHQVSLPSSDVADKSSIPSTLF